MLKAAIKQSPADQIRHRIIPSDAVVAMSARLDGLKDEIADIFKEERKEKVMRQADMEIRKGENMVAHEAEIFARPARTWFQSEKEKQAAKSESTVRRSSISCILGQQADASCRCQQGRLRGELPRRKAA